MRPVIGTRFLIGFMATKFEELIRDYLKGNLQKEDEKVLAMMLRLPENQIYLAAKIDEQLSGETMEEVVDERVGQQIFQCIQHELEEARAQQTAEVVQMPWYKRKAVRLITVAASVIWVIGLGILLFTLNAPDRQSVTLQNNQEANSSPLSFVHHEINTTGKDKRIKLPDGSLIILSNKSEVIYRQPFIVSRDITLIGKAYFKVTSDKTRPFTVISGDIATKALGTEFTITELKKAKQIIVRLYEGKVVIRPVNKGNKKMNSDVYLLPGQYFMYDANKKSNVKTFKFRDSRVPDEVMDSESDDPSLPQNSQGSWYMFNNQKLEHVLPELAALHGVSIVYNKQDIQKIYFTGKYNSAESIEAILKRIGMLNNLTITKKDSAFIISR